MCSSAKWAARVASIKNLDRYLAKLNAIPEKVRARMEAADNKLVDEGVAKLKAIMPIDPKSPNPGAARESVRKEKGSVPGSVSLVAGAPGFPEIGHLEFGHKDRAGGHVKAEPSFYPVVRQLKKTRKSRQTYAIKAGIKDATA